MQILDNSIIVEGCSNRSHVGFQLFDGLSLFGGNLLNSRLNSSGFSKSLSSLSIGFGFNTLNSKFGNIDIGVEFNLVTDTFCSSFKDVLTFYLSILNLVFESIWKSKGSELEENNLMEGVLGNSGFEIVFHGLLNLSS